MKRMSKNNALSCYPVHCRSILWAAMILLVWGFCLGPAGPAVAVSPEEIITQVQKKYDATGMFKTRFRQESQLKTAGAPDTAEGWLFFKKPSRMRWQYQYPPEQKKEVIADGREVSIYIPQDRMVMVYPLNQVLRSDLVMRFFSGMGRLQTDFTVTWDRPYQIHEPIRIRLKPVKPQPELKHLILTIDPETFLVQALEFSNAYGDHTRMSFTQTQLDIKLAPGFFTFIPPPGVEIVRDKIY
ncbi:LolA family protein [Desulfobacca acetoxidans]|uniref:Outer membrane lipoprotein carrier protein LolA n=1 Tax=Desulfobacca acetoxidans (strain ATCC 700848 / DSM 11109 / ASRB2) TaxID=880072 RepID=F2NFW6_DESAR|nr:outer membrane lipoprotein carrier protein LolA [Desulfobacca acetoxidans]AEB10235.1 outer membrane lipoprotein carrier protein LolA [Desulfobacca acetoxidans DSM 11109]